MDYFDSYLLDSFIYDSNKIGYFSCNYSVLPIFLNIKYAKRAPVKTIALMIFAFLLMGVLMVSPGWVSHIKAFAYKDNFNKGIFATRIDNWQNTYEGAYQGGWIGVGYGVAYGVTEFNLTSQLTASTYGREKSNAPLAVIEETGVIGFILYIALLLSLSKQSFMLYRMTQKNSHERILILIVSGELLGMVVHSFFEDWWSSPGSPIAIYFWSLVGVLQGLFM